MRKKDSWSSEYRKKKFYEQKMIKALKREQKEFKRHENLEIVKTPKTISVMLDLDGTSDNIDDAKAKVFFSQLEYIRKKFDADYGIVSVSTYYHCGIVMDDVLEILERNLPETFRIGLNFFYEGTYSYPDKVEIIRHPEFNCNKIDTFMRFAESDDVHDCWKAVFDDGIDEEAYKEYQHKRKMLFCRPSQDEEALIKNNFMSIASCKKSFDGVIDGLGQYIDNIRDLSPLQIMEKQEAMITHLSSFELMMKVRNCDYHYLIRYFSEGYADENDFGVALEWLLRVCEEDVTDEMLEIVDIILKRCSLVDKELLENKVKKFKK